MLLETDAFASRRRPRRKGVFTAALRRLRGDARPTPPWDDGAPIRSERPYYSAQAKSPTSHYNNRGEYADMRRAGTAGILPALV